MGNEIIFRRKIQNEFLRWKMSGSEKPLMIEGARRIGKSTVAEEFAKDKTLYDSHISIDFSQTSDEVKSFFLKDLDRPENRDEFFSFLSKCYDTPLYEHRSVLIFDEIQKFPRARESLKQLVADGRYDYIETGSLITINKNMEGYLIPDERKAMMYPMDFEEFCWALGEETLPDKIRESFKTHTPLRCDDATNAARKNARREDAHKKAMNLFRLYLLIGGMPKPVKAYVQNRDDLTIAEQEKRDILSLYEDDVDKATSSGDSDIKELYDRLPGLLAKHDKMIDQNTFDDGKYADSMANPFSWLADSKMCNVCYRCSHPDYNLTAFEDRTRAKCYMGDTGLLYSRTFPDDNLPDNETLKRVLKDKLSLNEGMIYENAIAQMLRSSGHKLYFYSEYDENHNTMEIDFLITEKKDGHDFVSPIEIKSTKGKYTTRSLNAFWEKYHGEEKIGTRTVIIPKPLHYEDGILYIPPYMTFCL